ncbi:carboxypeptidase-like regulatory domain-containing protein, partial [Singulisphaera rosea]
SVAAIPAGLADMTTKLAFAYKSCGVAAVVVPATVASLADRILTTFRIGTSKLSLAAAMVLIASGLTVAWASRPESDPNAIEAAAPKEAAPGKVSPVLVNGTVVDEAGRPVAGAEILVDPFSLYESRGTSGADGSFAVPYPRSRTLGSGSADGATILARSTDEMRLGWFTYNHELTEAQTKMPAQVVLKPAQAITAQVVDARHVPTPEAEIVAVESYGFPIVAKATTGSDGSARLRLPADALVGQIMAVKPGVGFDYAELGKVARNGQISEGAPTAKIPESIHLTLELARAVQVKAVDNLGHPIAGISFKPSSIHKVGRKSQADLPVSSTFLATTGPDGLATFDWVPKTDSGLTFCPLTEGYARRRASLKIDQQGPVIAKMSRTGAIRGRVFHPDGSTAAGVRIQASGSGQGIDTGFGRALTGDDGTYAMEVPPEELYVVYVEDEEWTAPTRLDVVVRTGHPVDDINFTLPRGVTVRGTVTDGPQRTSVAGEEIELIQDGRHTPPELLDPDDSLRHQGRRSIHMTTDSGGHYSTRVAPGFYSLVGPSRFEAETLNVKDGIDIVRDFAMPRPVKGPLSGRVLEAGGAGKGVAGAKVAYVSADDRSLPILIKTDDQGRFRCERYLDRATFYVRSPDHRLGGVFQIVTEAPEVIIPIGPTASASGLLLDEQGKPVGKQKLVMSPEPAFGKGDKRGQPYQFNMKVITDSEGRFTVTGLVIGQDFEIVADLGGTRSRVGLVRAEKAAPIDLGTLRIRVGRAHLGPLPRR